MRILLISTIILLNSTGFCSIERKPCVQVIYDSVYARLVKERLKLNLEKLEVINHDGLETIVNKNGIDEDLFELFRRLCRGQKSIYEREDRDERY